MQRPHSFKIKTINLDTDIFTQDKTMNNKLTVPLIRNLTQRKNRENKKLKEVGHQMHIKSIQRQQVEYNQESYVDRLRIKQNEEHFDHFAEFDNEFLKHHTKTNPSSQRKQYHTQRRSHFKRYNHSYSHQVQAKNEDPQHIFEQLHKDAEENGFLCKIDERQSLKMNDKLKVNPYTKDQYIYMRNRQMDQLMQLKRSGKLTRVNSITKSYRVATISLTPQNNRRANSSRMAMPNIPNKGRSSAAVNASFLRNMKKQSEIKPWQWIGPEQSKQYLI